MTDIIETRDEYVPDGEPLYGDSVLERAKQAAASEISAGAGNDERFVAECVVRAVLQAIREPDDEMVEIGGYLVAGLSGGKVSPEMEGRARDAFKAMIDAALSAD